MALSRRAFLGASLAAPALAQQRRRNILMITADDLGPTLGCYGDKAAATPRLDAFAAQGTRFTHAFCTTASCSPSRSVMYTGLHNHANGHYGLAHAEHNFALRTGIQTLPELLKATGYRTGSIGKLHVNPPPEVSQKSYWNFLSAQNPRDGVDMAKRVRGFLAGAGDQPFFLQVGFTDPHRGGPDFENKDYTGIVRKKYDPAAVPVPSWLPDTAAVRGDLAQYYESVHRLDQNVGMVLDALKEAGQWESTLVVFLSDNGMPFPNAKTTLYEAGIRLPFLMRVPGVRAGVTNRAMISFTDLTPTLLEWAGATAPRYALHGRSLLTVAGEENPPGWDRVFLSHTFHEITMHYPMRGLRTRQYKYIRNLAHQLPFPIARDMGNSPSWKSVAAAGETGRIGRRPYGSFLHRPPEELYDLESDADEIRNLSEEAAHRPALEEFRGAIRNWQKQTNDPWAARGV